MKLGLNEDSVKIAQVMVKERLRIRLQEMNVISCNHSEGMEAGVCLCVKFPEKFYFFMVCMKNNLYFQKEEGISCIELPNWNITPSCFLVHCRMWVVFFIIFLFLVCHDP